MPNSEEEHMTPETKITAEILPETSQDSSSQPESSSGRMSMPREPDSEENITAETKITEEKVTLVHLAERSRNVSETCRRRGVAGASYASTRGHSRNRAFRASSTTHPYRSPSLRKLRLTSKRRSWPSLLAITNGDRLRVSDRLRPEGILVSPSTVRSIWLNEGLETSYKRILGIKEERGDIERARAATKMMRAFP